MSKNTNKKIKMSQEFAYALGMLLLTFAGAMIAATGFGVSMIVGPAYILSEKISVLTFGQCEYIVQGVLLVIFCIVIKKFKPIYLMSFATALIYGAFLDLWRKIIPAFNPSVTSPSDLSMGVKICFFTVGTIFTAVGVALFFKTYLYPEVYDLFVKGIVAEKKLKMGKFKTCFDISFLVISVLMSLAFFGKIQGIGVGTLVMAGVNGTLINLFSNLFDKYFNIQPRFKKLAKFCEVK